MPDTAAFLARTASTTYIRGTFTPSTSQLARTPSHCRPADRKRPYTLFNRNKSSGRTMVDRFLLAPRATLAERVTPPARIIPAEPVAAITCEADLLAALELSARTLVIIRVHARWCRSCRALEPKWRRLARELAPDVHFAELEFEDNRVLAARLAVKVMPTFLIYDAECGKVDHFSCGPRRAHILRAHINHALENKVRRARGDDMLDMPDFV